FLLFFFFFFSSRRRHTRFSRDWSSDVCSSDLLPPAFQESCERYADQSCVHASCQPYRAYPMQSHGVPSLHPEFSTHEMWPSPCWNGFRQQNPDAVRSAFPVWG